MVTQVLIADAIFRYQRGQHHMLRFTCNCNGNGVMGSDLRSECLLNIQLVDAFMKGTKTECKIAGRNITLDPCVYVWDRESCGVLMNPAIVKPAFYAKLKAWLNRHPEGNQEPCTIKVDGTCFQQAFFDEYLRAHDPARFVFSGQPLPRLLGPGGFLSTIQIKQ